MGICYHIFHCWSFLNDPRYFNVPRHFHWVFEYFISMEEDKGGLWVKSFGYKIVLDF